MGRFLFCGSSAIAVAELLFFRIFCPLLLVFGVRIGYDTKCINAISMEVT